ncbi:MAG: HAMP domain-containing histidine kinase [Cyanobacteria bacterium SID2]|nr:HAMP domain-containing histidine kinase [Cyanobacteria bacterium SID2]MBP0006377.1 HAMP domain-containing histidine kinase [Cyanobacteria bacterium SBC]
MKYGTVRIEKIVNVLRVFSRLNESTVKEIDIHESIDSTLAILESQARVNLPHFKFEVIKNYNRLPKINCYAGQLNQVFVNLLENSIDSFQDLPKSIQPQISIVTEAIDDCIRVKISDNGSGIPPEIQDKIFDPFFTTKPVGQGTGLGLSTCYDIVRKHQGWIEVSSSTVDRGTEFIITLPVRPTFSPIASVVKSL